MKSKWLRLLKFEISFKISPTIAMQYLQQKIQEEKAARRVLTKKPRTSDWSRYCLRLGVPVIKSEVAYMNCYEKRTDSVDFFWGEYEFLSNLYPAKLFFDGIAYLNSEVAYQAQKCALMYGQ